MASAGSRAPVPEVVPAGGKLAPHHVFTLDRGSGSGVYHDPIAADGFPLKLFGRQDGEPVYQRALKDPNHVWHKIAKAEGLKRYMTEGVTVGSRDGIHWELIPAAPGHGPTGSPRTPSSPFTTASSGGT